MENIRIDTAQNVGIEYTIASIGDRIIAYLIDTVVIKMGYLLLVYFLTRDSGYFNSTVFIILVLLPWIFYDVLFEILNDGQTIGKRIRKIKVVMLDGSQPGIGSYLLRWIFRFIELDSSAGSVAMWSYLFSAKGQRLGDLAAGTTVVKLVEHNFSETIFEDIDPNYEPMFREAVNLKDSEAAVIREILVAFENPDIQRQNFDTIALEARNRIAARLRIDSDMGAVSFLDRVLKDYNHLHGKVGS